MFSVAYYRLLYICTMCFIRATWSIKDLCSLLLWQSQLTDRLLRITATRPFSTLCMQVCIVSHMKFMRTTVTLAPSCCWFCFLKLCTCWSVKTRDKRKRSLKWILPFPDKGSVTISGAKVARNQQRISVWKVKIPSWKADAECHEGWFIILPF